MKLPQDRKISFILHKGELCLLFLSLRAWTAQHRLSFSSTFASVTSCLTSLWQGEEYVPREQHPTPSFSNLFHWLTNPLESFFWLPKSPIITFYTGFLMNCSFYILLWSSFFLFLAKKTIKTFNEFIYDYHHHILWYGRACGNRFWFQFSMSQLAVPLKWKKPFPTGGTAYLT